MIRRREFITLLGGTLTPLAALDHAALSEPAQPDVCHGAAV